jgi:hypothetical protein
MLKIEVFTRLVIENQYFDIVFYSSRLFAGGSVLAEAGQQANQRAAQGNIARSICGYRETGTSERKSIRFLEPQNR